MKTANILRCHHWFSCKNNVWGKSAEIPFLWRMTTQNWVVLLIGLSRGLSNFSANQKHYSDLASSEAPSFLQMFFRHYFMGKPVVASRNFGTCFIRLYMLGWLRIDPHWVSWDFWSKRPFFKKLNNQTTFSLIKDTLILALLIIMVVHAERIHFFIGISSCLYLPLSLSEAA